jgi:hypothetical protein
MSTQEVSMSSAAIDSTRATLTVEPTRVRQTAPPVTPFRDVLSGGVRLLLAGAETATSVAGGPVLAAAVHEVRGSLGPPVASAPGLPAGLGGGSGSELGAMQEMQRESQAFNLQLLALQEEVQQENRSFSTLSNVLRAKHDTAKAAVGNIRS